MLELVVSCLVPAVQSPILYGLPSAVGFAIFLLLVLTLLTLASVLPSVLHDANDSKNYNKIICLNERE